MQLYPVMDGVYATCVTQNAMRKFIRKMFGLVAQTFIAERLEQHRFVIRGGLAYGPIMHGRNLGANASPVFTSNPGYRDAILLGMPMVQAHLSEVHAPPFGVAVDDSARVFAAGTTKPFTSPWYRWFTPATSGALHTALLDHLTWCSERSMPLLYDSPRIQAHRQMVEQYFAP